MDFAVKVLQLFAWQNLALVIEFITHILVVKALGDHGYGVYMIYYCVPMLVVSLGSWGLGPAIVYHQNKTDMGTTRLFCTFSLFALVSGFIYYLLFVGLLLGPLSRHYYQFQMDSGLYAAAMLYVPVLLMQKFVRALVKGLYKIKEFSLAVNFFPACLRLILVLAYLYYFNLELGGMIWIPVIVQTFILLLAVAVIRKEMRLPRRWREALLSWREFRAVFAFGLKNYLGGILQKGNDHVVKAFMVPLLSEADMGIFSIAQRIAGILTSLLSSIRVVFMPKVSRSSTAESIDLLGRLMRVSVPALSVMGLSFAAIIPMFVALVYGSDFTAVGPVAMILVPGIIFLTLTSYISMAFAQNGFPLVKSYIRGAGLLINLGLIYLFITKLGVQGAAYSITLSYGVMWMFGLYLAVALFKCSLRDLLIFKKSDGRYLMGIAAGLWNMCRRNKGSTLDT